MINVVLNGRIYDEDDDICMSLYVCLYVCEEGGGQLLASLATEVLPRAVGAAGPLSKYKDFRPRLRGASVGV